MNILLFDAADCLAEDVGGQSCFEITVGGARLARLKSLLSRHPRGASAGHLIRVGQLGGRVGTGEVLYVNDTQAVIRVVLQDHPIPKLPVTLVMALPRPKMLRRILRMVSELGVCELRLINTARVEKSYWQSPVLQSETLREYLLAGLMQTGDTILPQVVLHRSFKAFVAQALPTLVADKDFLVAHPGNFPPCEAMISPPTCLALGPEGGFTAAEIDQFMQHRGRCVSLGARVLRVETALPVVLSHFLNR